MMSYISHWLMLVSVILQISNLEAILYTPYCYSTNADGMQGKTLLELTSGNTLHVEGRNIQ